MSIVCNHINFSVSIDGLQDQLLVELVTIERQDLENKRKMFID